MQPVLPEDSQKAAPESSVWVTPSDNANSQLLACDIALFPPFQIEAKEMCPFFSPPHFLFPDTKWAKERLS